MKSMAKFSMLLMVAALFQVQALVAEQIRVKADKDVLVVEGNAPQQWGVVSFFRPMKEWYGDEMPYSGRKILTSPSTIRQGRVGLLNVRDPKGEGLYVLHTGPTVYGRGSLVKVERVIKLTDRDIELARAGKTLVINSDRHYWE